MIQHLIHVRLKDPTSTSAFAVTFKITYTMMLTTMYTLQTSTSSSSSSPSGATTPVDVIEPELVSFPRVAQAQPIRGLRSSGSSVFSLEHQRPPFKAALPFVPRPPKLSLDTRNVRPIPALPSASTESPLGAFCPTSSAESHLRYLVEYSILNPLPTRPGSPVSNHSPTPASTTHSRSRSISSRELSESNLTNKSSPFRRLRTSSFQSLSFSWSSADKAGLGHPSPYDVDADSEDEHEVQETFWPRRKQRKQATHKKVPSISRSSSPPSDDINVGAPAPSPALVTRNSALSTPSTHLNQLRARAGSASAIPSSSSSLLSIQSRTPSSSSSSKPSLAVSNQLRPAMHVRSSTTSLLPPKTPRSGNSSKSFLVAGSPSSSVRSLSSGGLNPALAAVENASRLRSRCVCGVCNRVGSDYPRCPRCSATWCSRQCRISEANGGKHTCRR